MSTANVAALRQRDLDDLENSQFSIFSQGTKTPRGYSPEVKIILRQLLAAQIDYSFTVTNYEREIRKKFEALASDWDKDTMLLSSTATLTSSRPYRQIVEMGWMAVPLILRKLESRPDHWFTALREITGENPVVPSHRGSLAQMTDDWLSWAKAKGISW